MWYLINLLTSLYRTLSDATVFTSLWLRMRPYTNNIAVKKKCLKHRIKSYKQGNTINSLLTENKTSSHRANELRQRTEHRHEILSRNKVSHQFKILNPGRRLSSDALLSKLNNSLAMKIWITTTIAQIYKCPMYITKMNPPIIQTVEYARIKNDLYLLRSLTSKLPTLDLSTSGGA